MDAPRLTGGLVSRVQVDGLVLLKVQKFCRDNSHAVVSGQLLGLDVGSTLEVTNCFPYLRRVEGDSVEEGANYQLEMMRCLRNVNVDSNHVGWYQSTYKGMYQTAELVETFMQYNKSLKRTVCIVYNPGKEREGAHAFKAITVTDRFMKIYQERNLPATKLLELGLAWSEIFQEIPISVHNSALCTAFMASVDSGNVLDEGMKEQLEAPSAKQLRSDTQHLVECIDEQQWELIKLSRHQRDASRNQQQSASWLAQRQQENMARRAKGEEPLSEEIPAEFNLPEPNNVESLLLANQLHGYCESLHETAAQALIKSSIMSGTG